MNIITAILLHMEDVVVNCNMFRFRVGCWFTGSTSSLRILQRFATLYSLISALQNGIETNCERICTHCKNLSISLLCFGAACLRRGSCVPQDGEQSCTAQTLPTKNIKRYMFTRQKVRLEHLARVVQRGRISTRCTALWRAIANRARESL